MASDDLIELEVLGVRRQSPPDQVVVLLLDLAGRRLLPIVVGVPEGSSIASAQAGIRPPRPMTHDLLVEVIDAADLVLVHTEIVALIDGVFHAALVLDNGQRLDARASDAIAVAVRTGSPVLCAPAVLDASAIAVEESTQVPAEEAELEQFREFLDTVTPEDFLGGEEGGDPGGGPAPRRS
ncbi:bifunctional nuclease family protein [Actinotalea sp. K2]|uniref:bifunctional nuclease family protein n=1 Tax=Actinotalea sp. K2 TaxID=2939438 RepID=UPI002017FBCA|nr:bifunctional nuclease family protein [Actinotalea sp. K2]MCL3862419.1 bifunctional nuclease family protein [Actinotalea sp. K2]